MCRKLHERRKTNGTDGNSQVYDRARGFSRTVNSVAPYIKDVSFPDLRSSGILRSVDF